MAIAIAHDIPYAATASLQNLTDLRRKVKTAQETDGPSLLHIHTPCPTGWGYDPSLSIRIAKSAVTSGSWLLYEYRNGKITINFRPKALAPVEEYLKPQGRFRHLTPEDIARVQSWVAERFERFAARAENS